MDCDQTFQTGQQIVRRLNELEADVARTFAILERAGAGAWDGAEGAAA